MSISDRIQTQSSRAVFLMNTYMNGIHTGIQAGHAISRLHMTHPKGCPSYPILEEWDATAPWFMLYDGGFASHLEASARAIEAINEYLMAHPHPLLPEGATIPFARFHEGVDELNGALTSVAIMVPGALILEDDDGDVPEAFAKLLGASGRRRAEVARLRDDLPVEYRLNLLFHGLPFAT